MLADLLSARKAAVLQRWLDLILESYPPETARFLQRDADRFVNPVGHTLSEGTAAILEEMLHGADPGRLNDHLDRIVRIRAVQQLSPSQAVAFVFQLKQAIREVLGEEWRPTPLAGELLEFETALDRLALQAFDLYTRCREKIYELRVGEARRQSEVVLERLNKVYGQG